MSLLYEESDQLDRLVGRIAAKMGWSVRHGYDKNNMPTTELLKDGVARYHYWGHLPLHECGRAGDWTDGDHMVELMQRFNISIVCLRQPDGPIVWRAVAGFIGHIDETVGILDGSFRYGATANTPGVAVCRLVDQLD